MDWIEYDREKWHEQPLPPQNRYVLCEIAPRRDPFGGELPHSVAVGFMRFAAGDRHSPHFIVPGVGGPVIGWCDCLGDDYKPPHLKLTNKQFQDKYGERL